MRMSFVMKMQTFAGVLSVLVSVHHQRFVFCAIYIYIQDALGGMDKTSGECSLCQTIPI